MGLQLIQDTHFCVGHQVEVSIYSAYFTQKITEKVDDCACCQEALHHNRLYSIEYPVGSGICQGIPS